NGKVLHAYANAADFANELQEQLGENADSIKKYLNNADKLYNNVGEVFLNHSLHKRKTWVNKKIVKAFRSVKLSHLFKTLHGYNTSNLKSAEAVQLFNRYATYNGSSPYKAPGMLSLIPHLEMNEGTYYPTGGMVSITNALFKLAQKLGVQFSFSKQVQRIIHNDGNVKGIVVDDVNVNADIVVSNADIYFTYKNLLHNSHRATQALKQERSSSALVFYWGIGKKFEEFELHNILFSKNYKAEFEGLFKYKTLYNDPTVYINITSQIEQSQAPAGKQNWFVMINAPANVGQDWETLKQKARAVIIEKINKVLQTNIEEYIEVEELLDPLKIEASTDSYAGSLYGTSSNSKLAAFLRHPNFKNNIKGLYFCGGSVHPGGGIPLCLKSAKIVSDLVN
ncbi:MAG: FAD-dependent oxidoreductase, partial [Ferruginibacter sp.]|nr:FAD-dependent oxidoreductase [Ferruginibacter sp.]